MRRLSCEDAGGAESRSSMSIPGVTAVATFNHKSTINRENTEARYHAGGGEAALAPPMESTACMNFCRPTSYNCRLVD